MFKHLTAALTLSAAFALAAPASASAQEGNCDTGRSRVNYVGCQVVTWAPLTAEEIAAIPANATLAVRIFGVPAAGGRQVLLASRVVTDPSASSMALPHPDASGFQTCQVDVHPVTNIKADGRGIGTFIGRGRKYPCPVSETQAPVVVKPAPKPVQPAPLAKAAPAKVTVVKAPAQAATALPRLPDTGVSTWPWFAGAVLVALGALLVRKPREAGN